MEKLTERTAIIVGFDQEFVKRFRKVSLVVGVALIVTGLTGAIMPQFLSLVSELFLGWLAIMAGVLSGYIVFLSRGRSMIAWLKPALLLLTGALFLLYPLAGIAAMALLLTIYLMLDALASFGLAHDYHPLEGWGWMVFNGLLSLILAIALLVGWPAASPILLGFYIGISLLFDGLALVFMSLASRKVLEQ